MRYGILGFHGVPKNDHLRTLTNKLQKKKIRRLRLPVHANKVLLHLEYATVFSLPSDLDSTYSELHDSLYALREKV
jgi:hypothetical protein